MPEEEEDGREAEAVLVADGAVSDSSGVVDASGRGETVAVEVASAGTEESNEVAVPVAKTPGELSAVAVKSAAEALVTAEVGSEDAPAAEGVAAEAAAAWPVQLTGGWRFTPIVPVSTESPGSGYTMSSPSTVTQPSETPSRLATNMAGNWLWRRTLGAGAYRFFFDAVIVAGPQFI